MKDILPYYLPIIERMGAAQDLEIQQRAAGKQTVLTVEDEQTINAQKTFANAPVRVLDGTGTLIHAFGTKT